MVGRSLLSKSCKVPDDIKEDLSDNHDGEPVDIVLELGSNYKIRPQSYGHPGIVVDLPSGSTEETGIAIYIDFGSSPMQKVGERQWLYPQKGEVLFDVLTINGDNAEVRYQAIKVGPLKRPRKLVLSQFRTCSPTSGFSCAGPARSACWRRGPSTPTSPPAPST